MNRLFLAGLVIGLITGILIAYTVVGEYASSQTPGPTSGVVTVTVTSTYTSIYTSTYTETLRPNTTSTTSAPHRIIMGTVTAIIYPNGTVIYVYGRGGAAYNPTISPTTTKTSLECEELRQSYEEQIRQLKEKYEGEKLALQAQLENLRERLQAKIRLLNDTVARLEKTISMLDQWYGIYTSDEEKTEFIQGLLVLARNSPAAKNLASQLAAETREPGDTLIALFSWIMLHLAYYPDPVMNVSLPGGAVITTQQYWSLPSEVLELRGGDCEDLALLAYAVIANTLPGAETYLVVLGNGSSKGHVAVLVRTEQGYYIVDPAGDYLNGWQAALSIGSSLVNPLSLEPDAKNTLISSEGAKLVYTTPLETAMRPSIEPAKDPSELLREWLTALGLDPNTTRIELYTPTWSLKATGVEAVAEALSTR